MSAPTVDCSSLQNAFYIKCRFYLGRTLSLIIKIAYVVLNTQSHFAIVLAGHGYQVSVPILRNVI